MIYNELEREQLRIEDLQVFEKLIFGNKDAINCKVFKCRIKNDTSQKIFALKMFQKQKEQESEIKFFKQVPEHQGIVKCISSDMDYIILEYLENGDLYYYISASKRQFPVTLARYYFKKIVETVQFIHKQNFIHRDLKLENILLDSKYEPKLCDFAYTTKLKQVDNFLDRFLGTEGYMSPQMINRIPYNGIKNDVFSLGVTLFIMVQGFMPFEKKASSTDKYYKFFYEEFEDKYWEKLSKDYQLNFDQDFIDLINGMLCNDEDFRMSLEDVINHPWLKKEVMEEQERIEVMDAYKQKIEKKFS